MRLKLLALLGAAALVVLGAMPVSAGEGNQDRSYLALGDSVAFGTSPLIDPRNAGSFTGYPEIVAQSLGIDHTNAACPGEATGGFIDPQGLDNVCRPYRANYPLHVAYTGTQLSFAIAYLKSHPETKLVTLNLGANDLFRLRKGVVTPTPSGCYTPDPVAYATTCLVQNLQTIFEAIRETGYEGLIVALTYYAIDYADVAGLQGAYLLNGAMIAAAAQSENVLVASGFDAFAPAALAAGGSSCAAGLLIHVTATSCDIHPSPAGRDLLAAAVLQTIANSCPAHNARRCLRRDRD
jgi:lysophospholipase L1-like esterase